MVHRTYGTHKNLCLPIFTNNLSSYFLWSSILARHAGKLAEPSSFPSRHLGLIQAILLLLQALFSRFSRRARFLQAASSLSKASVSNHQVPFLRVTLFLLEDIVSVLKTRPLFVSAHLIITRAIVFLFLKPCRLSSSHLLFLHAISFFSRWSRVFLCHASVPS